MELKDLILQTLDEVAQEEQYASPTESTSPKGSLLGEGRDRARILDAEEVVDLDSLEVRTIHNRDGDAREAHTTSHAMSIDRTGESPLDSTSKQPKDPAPTQTPPPSSTHPDTSSPSIKSQARARTPVSKPSQPKPPAPKAPPKSPTQRFPLPRISIESSPITEGKLIPLSAQDLRDSRELGASRAGGLESSQPPQANPTGKQASRQAPKPSPALSPEYVAFLENLREKLLVLFAGLKTPGLQDREGKLDLVLRFLQYQLCVIDDTLQKDETDKGGK